ncbi:MAG: hypothetical protein ACXVZR_11715, partial [Terriglobales bacterium]
QFQFSFSLERCGEFAGSKPRIGVIEVGLLAGAFGVSVLAFVRVLRRAPLVPIRDPFLQESLHYHA